MLLDELTCLLRELLGVGTELVERLEEAVDVHGDVFSVVVAVRRPSSGRGSESISPGTFAVPDDDQSTNPLLDHHGIPLRGTAAFPGDCGAVTRGYYQGTRRGLAPGCQGRWSEGTDGTRTRRSNETFERRGSLSGLPVVSSFATPSRGTTLPAPHEH